MIFQSIQFQANWTEALKQCRSKNMDLVSILSKEDNDNVIKAIKDASKLIDNFVQYKRKSVLITKNRINFLFLSVKGQIGFWTSGNRRKTNDVYFWGNGIPLTYTNWEAGKPDNVKANNGEEEECIEIKGLNILKWNDSLCSNELYFICEESHDAFDKESIPSL